MRTHGTLIKWNDDRGFGFIEPATATAEIFVHISAFPHDGVRPRVGEVVSYEVELRKDDKPQATRIMRPATAHRPRLAPIATTRNRRRSPLTSIGAVLLVAAIVGYAYFSQPHSVPPATVQPATLVAPLAASTQPFSCDSRTRCPQMRSCAEATYFLNHCPGTTMDGDHDGVPCEGQWCNASSND